MLEILEAVKAFNLGQREDFWQTLPDEIRVRLSDDGKHILAARQHEIGEAGRKSWGSTDYDNLFTR
jgi:hypothetical protein